MALIDGKYLLVEQENPTFDVDITSQPVEKDSDMTDHVRRKARTMGITGQVSGPGAGAMLTYLKKVSDKGIIVKYVGRTAFTGIISGLATGHSYKIANGYTVSFTITEVRVASSSYVDKSQHQSKLKPSKLLIQVPNRPKKRARKERVQAAVRKRTARKQRKARRVKRKKSQCKRLNLSLVALGQQRREGLWNTSTLKKN